MEDGWHYSRKEQRIVLAASCIAIFVNPLIGSMLNLALGAIQLDFNCSEHNLSWISSIYFLVSVVFLLPCTRLADIYGKKKTFIIGIIIGIVGLVLSASSVNVYMLYVCRGVTAIGMAFVSCTGISMISDVYPPWKRGGAIGINTASVYIGASIGPTLGGLITDYLTWRAVFLVIIPLLAIALILIWMFRDNIANTPNEPMDRKGSVIYGTGIFLTMFGVISLPAVYSFVLIAVGIILIVLFVMYETKIQYPILYVSLFKNTSFSRSMVALFLNYASSFCVMYFMSRYLQGIGGLSPTDSGLILMVQPAMQVVFSLITGRMSDRLDGRILPTLGMAILCVGLVMMFAVTSININYPMIIAASAVMGMGFGIFSAPNTNAVMSYVKKEHYNHASGMISLFRQSGMMISMGIATCLISIFLGTETQLVPENFDAFITVLKYGWAICIVFNLVGCFFSFFRGKNVERK